jgi:hypothetical protein
MITNFHSTVQAKIIQTGNGSEAEIDLSELHQKSGNAASRPVARSGNESPKTAVFEKRRSYGVAAKGESHSDANATGTTPTSRKVFYPIKTKTQSNHQPRRYREHQSKGCADKVRYHTHAEAHDVIRGMVRNKSKKRPFRSLKSYACPNCNGWHIHST